MGDNNINVNNKKINLEAKMKYILLVMSCAVLVISATTTYRYIEKTEELVADYQDSQKLSLETTIALTNQYNELLDEYERLKQGLKDKVKVVYEPYTITGYSACDPSQGTTDLVRTGFCLSEERVKHLPIIAVDPKVIPLYSIVEIKDIGVYIALDTGGLIKGNRIDILFDTKEEAMAFGVSENYARIIDNKS